MPSPFPLAFNENDITQHIFFRDIGEIKNISAIFSYYRQFSEYIGEKYQFIGEDKQMYKSPRPSELKTKNCCTTPCIWKEDASKQLCSPTNSNEVQ